MKIKFQITIMVNIQNLFYFILLDRFSAINNTSVMEYESQDSMFVESTFNSQELYFYSNRLMIKNLFDKCSTIKVVSKNAGLRLITTMKYRLPYE